MNTKTHVRTTVNGEDVDFLCEPRQSLLECLRDVLHLTGTKEGCNDGNCGACTVMLDGRIVNSCLVLGVETQGREIGTVEGIATPAGLHPVQQAYLENAALQCGFCTPGFIVASKALLESEPNPSEARIRRWLTGNLCRCTGYDKIVRAVLDAAARPTKVASGHGGGRAQDDSKVPAGPCRVALWPQELHQALPWHGSAAIGDKELQ